MRLRPWMALWLVVLVGMAGGVWGLYARCPGCIDRTRVNTACAWTGDTAFVIDPANVAQREHLVADAQLAEELAIRHADAEVGKRFGVEHHGGLLEHGSFRQACLARMFQEIEQHHRVSAEQILVARGQRDRLFDLAVVVLFLPLYAFATIGGSLWLARRFSADGRLVLFVATAVVSVMVGVLGLQSLQLWGAIWEVIRVGNGHMTSMRAATYTRWGQQHVDVEVLGSILLFWVIALCCYRVVRTEPAYRA
jgi:hypothetical protein